MASERFNTPCPAACYPDDARAEAASFDYARADCATCPRNPVWLVYQQPAPWGGAGAPGGDAERRAVREIVDREGDRGARANRGRGEGDGRTRAGDRGERGADAT